MAEGVDIPINPGDEFDFELPQVNSVTDATTGDNGGSILGGDTLTIEGLGFNVPSGGSAEVGFGLNGTIVKTAPLASSAESPGQITVTSPNLSTLVGDVNDDGQLDLDVLVHIDDGQGDSVSSVPSDGSEHDVYIPYVNSVTDATTGDNGGSILGGDTLTIEGLGFNVPSGGSAEVGFGLNGTIVKMVPLASSAVNPGQITVTSPNLSTLVGDVNDDGQLDLDVLVHIDDGQGDSVSSVPSDGSEYDAVHPRRQLGDRRHHRRQRGLHPRRRHPHDRGIGLQRAERGERRGGSGSTAQSSRWCRWRRRPRARGRSP